jgi:hypothetical protein
MEPLRTHRITLGACLRITGIVLLVLIILAYVHFQARSIIQGPIITLRDQYSPIQSTQQVTLTGTAQNITKITLNGREIHTDGNGNFSETIMLEKGYTQTQLLAQDRFGRMTKVTRAYVYVPEQS